MLLDQRGNKMAAGVVSGVIVEGSGVTLPAGRSTLTVDPGCSYLVTCMGASRFLANIIAMGGGGYAKFGGLTGFITVPDNNALDLGTDDFTICFRSNAQSGQIVAKGYTNPETFATVGFGIDLEAGFAVFDGTNFKIIPFPVLPSKMNFIAIIYTHATDTCQISLNSVLQTPVDITGMGNLDAPENPALVIGAAYDNLNAEYVSFLFGSLDDLRIYKGIAATPAQVENIVASGGVYDESQAGAASFVLPCDTDFDVDGKIYDSIGNLAGTKTGDVTIENYPSDSALWAVGPSQTSLIKVPHSVSTLYYESVGNVFVRKLL